MRRPYTLDDYRRLVDGMPRASAARVDRLRHDRRLPGETDDDFAANLAYLPSSPLTHLHVFPYSDRPGTEASAMRDKVHGIASSAIAAADYGEIGAGLDARASTRRRSATVRPGADARGRNAGGD